MGTAGQVGIAVAAVGVPREIVRRFYLALASSPVRVPYRVHVEREGNPAAFCITRTKNRAILALVPHCQTIVCTDVDMLIPPGLVDHTASTVRDGQALWALCGNLPREDLPETGYRWSEWSDRPLRTTGRGSWVALTTADWFRVGGWDERLTGYEGDDTAFPPFPVWRGGDPLG